MDLKDPLQTTIAPFPQQVGERESLAPSSLRLSTHQHARGKRRNFFLLRILETTEGERVSTIVVDARVHFIRVEVQATSVLTVRTR